jgi:hypothetical protein
MAPMDPVASCPHVAAEAGSVASFVGVKHHIGRRLSMLSMLESVELRVGPLSVTRSLMRMLGRLPEACEVGGGGVRPSLRGGGGCRGAL